MFTFKRFCFNNEHSFEIYYTYFIYFSIMFFQNILNYLVQFIRNSHFFYFCILIPFEILRMKTHYIFYFELESNNTMF